MVGSGWGGDVPFTDPRSLTHWSPGDVAVILNWYFQTHTNDRYVEHILFNWPQVNATRTLWRLVSFGSGHHGLVLSGKTPLLPEPMSTKFYDAVWRHQATISLRWLISDIAPSKFSWLIGWKWWLKWRIYDAYNDHALLKLRESAWYPKAWLNIQITNFPQLDMIKCSRFDCDFVVLHYIDRTNGTMIWYGLSSNGIIFPEHAFCIMPICQFMW